jgi:hypothetical protein
MEEGMPPPEAVLLAELQGMKMRALQKKAEALSVNEDRLDDAEEKAEVIALIVAKVAERSAADETARVARVKEELEGMKLRALQKRAEELGVDEDKLDDAEEKAEVIALILELVAKPSPDGGEEVAAARAAEAEAARLAQLKEELEGMKLRALQKRAEELGVDEDKLDDAEEKAEVIALILETSRAEAAPKTPAPAALRPHFGSAPSSATEPEPEPERFPRLQEIFGRKHCMFSYNWGVQEEVKAARSLIAAAGVPTWYAPTLLLARPVHPPRSPPFLSGRGGVGAGWSCWGRLPCADRHPHRSLSILPSPPL